MSSTYGPVVLTNFGTIQQVSISSETASLLIENQSLYDMLFSVQPSQPQTMTQAMATSLIAANQPITTGGWDLHIGPRDFGVLSIPAAYLIDSPQGKYWTGTMWVELINVTNAFIVPGSIVSQPGNNCWITAYGPGETPPVPNQGSLGFFLASQVREIALQPGPLLQSLATVTPSATLTWTSFGAGSSIGNYPFSNAAITAGVTASGTFFIYLYSMYTCMFNLSAVAGTAESQSFQVRFIVQDSSLATVSTSSLVFYGFMAHLALQSRCETSYMPAQPQAFSMTCTAGTGPPYSIQTQMQVFGANGGGGTNIKPQVFDLWYDIASSRIVGATGGAAGISNSAVFSGFVF